MTAVDDQQQQLSVEQIRADLAGAGATFDAILGD
jgi:hypothetical protein